MSHYTTVKTKLTRRDTLVSALEVQNPQWKGKIEVNDTAANLYGYHGDKREQTAEIVVRRKHISDSSNDIGFKLQEDGTYEVIVSDYDKSIGYNATWLKKLEQNYSAQTIKEVADEYGYDFTMQEDGEDLVIECEQLGY